METLFGVADIPGDNQIRILAAMEEQYAGDSFEFAVIYGRRRVGKTALIVEFIRDKPAVFFTARETNLAENLALLSGSIQAPPVRDRKGPGLPVHRRRAGPGL